LKLAHEIQAVDRHDVTTSGNHYFLKRKCKGVKRCQNSVRTGPDTTRFTDDCGGRITHGTIA
jgi:hypothetical protein